jgi:hypothetical protein
LWDIADFGIYLGICPNWTYPRNTWSWTVKIKGCWSKWMDVDQKKLETWTEQILLGLWLVILHPATTYIWDHLGMLAWGRHLQVPRIDWTSEHAFSFLNRS